MPDAQPELDDLKRKLRAMWMAGDFGQIALFSAKAAEEFVGRLHLRSGSQVLDVACGTGNLAIPAARAGAEVRGIDIAPNLLAQARERAAAEGLQASFEEADAEQLPFPAAAFGTVMSMFGAMFAPRPDRVAAELLRVCRPGGLIAMANWLSTGFIADTFALGARFSPPPPGVPSPLLLGQEAIVRERLAAAAHLQMTPRTIRLHYPFAPAEVVQLFRKYFGPTQMTFARLDPQNQAAYAAELEKLWRAHNQASGSETVVDVEYLEVLATRA
jgi:ubiquinone/menaquinone biosynthesis C-methylase UbiE